MLKRTLRISTITLCILCTFFLICTGVFAATRQSTNISTTVQFTPGLQVIVTATVGDSSEQVVFNNTSTTPQLSASQYFKTSGTPSTFASKNEIVVKVYNYTTDKDIDSIVISLIDAKGAYMEKANAQIESVSFASTIARKSGSTINSAESEGFRIISLYQNLDITMQVAITSND